MWRKKPDRMGSSDHGLRLARSAPWSGRRSHVERPTLPQGGGRITSLEKPKVNLSATTAGEHCAAAEAWQHKSARCAEVLRRRGFLQNLSVLLAHFEKNRAAARCFCLVGQPPKIIKPPRGPRRPASLLHSGCPVPRARSGRAIAREARQVRAAGGRAAASSPRDCRIFHPRAAARASSVSSR